MARRVKNVTFSLPVDLLEKFKDYAKNNYVPSVNAAVCEAMEKYSTLIEKEKLRQEMTEASKDPLFMKDLKDTMKDFETSDAETSRRIPEW